MDAFQMRGIAFEGNLDAPVRWITASKAAELDLPPLSSFDFKQDFKSPHIATTGGSRSSLSSKLGSFKVAGINKDEGGGSRGGAFKVAGINKNEGGGSSAAERLKARVASMRERVAARRAKRDLV
eukprot:196420-Prorocentrum_minimum.AAC.1